MGVKEVLFMPDYFGIGVRALQDLAVSLKADFLDMKADNRQEDSARAAEILNKLGVACIITLGGDGTNRVVAKTCGDTPLLAISTGTNNVFPVMVEGTLAGMAAGVAALNSSSRPDFIKRVPRLVLKYETEQKTHRAVVIQEAVEMGGVASQVVKSLMDSSFDYLDAPIKTVAAGNTVIPFSPPLEDAMLPDEAKIIAAVKEIAG